MIELVLVGYILAFVYAPIVVGVIAYNYFTK